MLAMLYPPTTRIPISQGEDIKILVYRILSSGAKELRARKLVQMGDTMTQDEMLKTWADGISNLHTAQAKIVLTSIRILCHGCV